MSNIPVHSPLASPNLRSSRREHGGPASRPAGFTLIELMIGLAIISLLLSLGVPSFNTYLCNSEIRSTAEAISHGLRLAQAEATRRNTPVSFTLVARGDPGFTVNVFNASTLSLVGPPLHTYSKFEAGKSARAMIAPASAVAVTFNGLGRVISPSPIATPNLQHIDVTSVIANEARTLRVQVDDTQAIRICDPDPALKLLAPPDLSAC